MKIKELVLHADNLVATADFYSDVLSLPLLEKDEKQLVFAAGDTVLKFIKSNKEQPIYHIAFNIPSNKLAEAFKWISLKVEPISVTGDEKFVKFDNWNANAFYFYDNNQNLLELIARNDLANPSDQHFGANLIISISEIGIVLEDVKAAGSKLIDQGLNYFAKQPPQDEFAAIGDDEGLLILVNKGRFWFPTKIASASFKVKIKIEDKGKNFELEF